MCENFNKVKHILEELLLKTNNGKNIKSQCKNVYKPKLYQPIFEIFEHIYENMFFKFYGSFVTKLKI